jgi:hypothetical protein
MGDIFEYLSQGHLLDVKASKFSQNLWQVVSQGPRNTPTGDE